jgi:RNA polymerase sigma-70 factor (ECF subfamily)
LSGIESEASSAWRQQLVDAQNGDREALGSLLQAYWQSLWSHAANQLDLPLLSKKSASDLVQDTFLEAHNSISKFQGSTPIEFHGWLQSILVNNLRDTWRKHLNTQKRQVRKEVRLDHELYPQRLEDRSLTSPIDWTIEQERKARVMSVMAQLPEHYQKVIRMRHFESMTFENIAVLLIKSPDAARQLWYRAIELFAEALRNDESR